MSTSMSLSRLCCECLSWSSQHQRWRQKKLTFVFVLCLLIPQYLFSTQTLSIVISHTFLSLWLETQTGVFKALSNQYHQSSLMNSTLINQGCVSQKHRWPTMANFHWTLLVTMGLVTMVGFWETHPRSLEGCSV